MWLNKTGGPQWIGQDFSLSSSFLTGQNLVRGATTKQSWHGIIIKVL
jgi:hypothetical protein